MAEKVHPAEKDRYGSQTTEQTAAQPNPSATNTVPIGPQSTPVVTEQPEQPGETQVVVNNPTVTTPSTYQPKYDWSKMTMADAYNQGLHTQAEIIEDRRRWGKENNDPINYFEAAMLFPNEHDINKTKTQNEEDIKRAARKEKMDQIGNFLANLGNFVGTAGFGGMDIKPEDPVKFTERQRQIRDKTIALRNAYNKDFFSNMAKMQSEERLAENARAMQALKDAQAKAAQQKADDNTRKTDSQIDVNNSRIAYYNAQTGKIEMLTPKQIEEIQSRIVKNQQTGNAALTNANTASRRESRMAQGTTTEETKTGRNTKVVRRRVGTGASTSSQSKGRTKINY